MHAAFGHRRTKKRGYALAFVLTVLILLGLGSMLVLYVLTAGIAETRRALGGQRVFYSCDSAIRLASKVVESVVLANPRATATDVTHLAMDAICDAAGGCIGARGGAEAPLAAEYIAAVPGDAAGPAALMPPHTAMERFYVRVQPLQSVNTIMTGAFRDLFAIQSRVRIRVQGMHIATGTVATARDMFTLGTISPFNLMAFANAPISWQPFLSRAPFISVGIPLTRVGPSVYADGVLNLGGGATLNLTRAVSTGTMTAAGARIWNGDEVTPIYNAFAGPDGMWANQIGTPLKLPAEPARKQNQPAAERERSTRWLLDPPIYGASGDNAGAREAKLAGQADIRIIDGVWFIKPPTGSSEPEWPGIPIWSDHMGLNVSPARAETVTLMTPPSPALVAKIGQEDLRTRHTWTTGPKRYSYYERDEVVGPPALTADPLNNGVVSYGMLRVEPGGITEPGAFDGLGATGPPCGSVASPSSSEYYLWRACPAPRNALLDAARYGFWDASARDAGTDARKVLPMNFDVGKFLAALVDGTPGELGSYFCGARVDPNDPTDVPTAGCRHFNGIVWITASWPGSLKGLVDSTAALGPPRQGNQAPWPAASNPVTLPVAPPNGFPNQVNNRHHLPEVLCTASALQGLPMGEHAASVPAEPEPMKRFPAVGCGSAAYNAIHANAGAPLPTVTALRLFNARDLSVILDHPVPQRFGSVGGFTVASNLPVYLFGDWNIQTGAPATSASVCPAPGVTPVPTDCLLPRTIVAGDRITFLSNSGEGTSTNPGYNDPKAAWHESTNTSQARQTTYVSAFMFGLAGISVVPVENIESEIRVMQRWDYNLTTGRPTMKLVGAMYAMGRAVYRPERQAVIGGRVPQPRVDWVYNPQLSTLNQPPGTPRFLIGVTNRWRDLRDVPE